MKLFEDIKHAFQRVKRKYSDDMCYSLNYTLLDLLPDMIEDMRLMKHGYPELDFKEVDNMPKDWINSNLKLLELEFSIWDYDKPSLDDPFTRWHLILLRICYCLREANENVTTINNKYYDKFNKAMWPDTSNAKSFNELWGIITKPVEFDNSGKPKLYTFNTKEVDPKLSKKYFKEECRIFNYRDNRKNEAFNLMKKYFWNLWD